VMKKADQASPSVIMAHCPFDYVVKKFTHSEGLSLEPLSQFTVNLSVE